MNLSNDHLAEIKKIITESEITNGSMQEDLIDHLCCEVEQRMTCGCVFNIALQEALSKLAPNELKEIELEAFLLLNSKTITMKKLTYFSGALFSVLSSIGILLKILHWFGANELLILGFGGLLLIFLPLLWIARDKQLIDVSSFDRRRNIAALLSLIFISGGAVLKVLHLASANEALLLGTTVFSLVFVPMTFIKMYRQSIAA